MNNNMPFYCVRCVLLTKGNRSQTSQKGNVFKQPTCQYIGVAVEVGMASCMCDKWIASLYIYITHNYLCHLENWNCSYKYTFNRLLQLCKHNVRGIDDIHPRKSLIALKVIDNLNICIIIYLFLQRNTSLSSKQWSLWCWWTWNKDFEYVMGEPKAFGFLFAIYMILSTLL